MQTSIGGQAAPDALNWNDIREPHPQLATSQTRLQPKPSGSQLICFSLVSCRLVSAQIDDKNFLRNSTNFTQKCCWMSLRLAWILLLECLSPSSVMVAPGLVVPDRSAPHPRFSFLPLPCPTSAPAVRHHDKRRPKETRWKIKWNTKSINCNVACPSQACQKSSSARLKIPPINCH